MLRNIGSVYELMGQKQKAQDFYAQADAALSRSRRQPAQSQGEANLAAMRKSLEGETLLMQGTAESLRLAAQKYEEALPLWRAASVREGEAATLTVLGLINNSLGENQKALAYYNQALAIHRAVGDRDGEAATLDKIRAVNDALGKNEKEAPSQGRLAAQRKYLEGETLRKQGTAESLRLAAQRYEEALSLWRAIGDRLNEGRTLSDIGGVYYSLGENQKALDYYAQALPIRRAAGDRRGEHITLSSIGNVYYSLGENQRALDYYAQALPIIRAAGDRIDEATTLSNIGVVYNSLGENQRALDYYARALPLIRAAGDRDGEASALSNIGLVYNSLGENQKALEFYNQALPIYRAAGNRRGEAIALNNIGHVYNSQGENQKALEFYNQALPIYRAAGGHLNEATALNNIGGVYNSLDEYQKALDYYAQALPIQRAAGDRRGEASTLNNIGVVYMSLGEKQKALDFYNQSMTLIRAMSNRREEAATLSNIGDVYHSLNEDRKALDYYAKGLALQRIIGDRSGEATALLSVGRVYNLLGERRKALDIYTQALAIHRAVGDRRREAITLNSIGGVYYSLGEKQKALDYYAQALPIQRAVGYLKGEAATLSNIAHVKRDLGQFDESRSQIEAALKIIESIRAKVDSKELRASYFATEQGHYKFYIDLLMRLRSLEPAKGHDAAALQASERARARSLLESLAEARADIRRGADPKLIERERLLQQRLNAKAEEALKLSSSGAGDNILAARRREIDAVTIELQQVQTQIRQTSPRYAALTQPQPLTIAEIRRQALDADTLLLEYSLGVERSFLWAVTPATINSYDLPKRDDVEAAAKRVYELLSKARGQRGQAARPGVSGSKEASAEYLAAATSLSRMLLGPVASRLGKKRLVIVADGMLHYIPFGALPDPNSLKESGGSWQPLVVEHEIVNLPSASTIAVLRRELVGRKPAAKTLAVLADPVFSSDDERIRPGASLAAQRNDQRDPLDESRARILVEIAGGAPGDLGIKRLPFTRQEAEAITALAPAGSGMKALDFEASRATAISGRLSQYRYVHFATHGLADSERPELSTLLLSLYDAQGRPQDGFLRAHEVYNLELPAELVTLSACETGLGKLTMGEGLVSLTRGFMYAGAARVVVSLWSVNDRATAELMTKFYRRVLIQGERPAAALRAAQVEMWRDKRWGAPYYWAAFTLQGEWR